MAFKNGLSERLDELRFTSPRSPPSESPFSGYTSPPRGQTNFMTAFQQPSSNDVRANLQRRFTTDSSKLSWPNISQQTPQLPEAPDLLSSVSRVLRYPDRYACVAHIDIYSYHMQLKNYPYSLLVTFPSVLTDSLTRQFRPTS